MNGQRGVTTTRLHSSNNIISLNSLLLFTFLSLLLTLNNHHHHNCCVIAKSCFGQLSANDIFLSSLRFSTGQSSKVLSGYFTIDKGSDIEFVQDGSDYNLNTKNNNTLSSSSSSSSSSNNNNSNNKHDQVMQAYRSHFIVCPVPRGSSIICNKSMIDIDTQEKLADQYGFQYDVAQSIYTTIRIDRSDPNTVLIGKYTHKSEGLTNWKQFQPMRDSVMQSLSANNQKSSELLFEPLVGHIYLFNISRAMSFDNTGGGVVVGEHTLFSYDIVKMMVVSMIGSTISVRWDVLYSSTGDIVDCFIESDARFSVKIGDTSLNVIPTVMGAHVAVFVSVVSLSLCFISLFIYQIFRCKCWQKSKYFAME